MRSIWDPCGMHMHIPYGSHMGAIYDIAIGVVGMQNEYWRWLRPPLEKTARFA